MSQIRYTTQKLSLPHLPSPTARGYLSLIMDKLIIKGAREHNLKNIDLELPRDKLIVISGLSGSGKSSLAFDTIFAEGQRRYVESLSAYARQFLGRMDKPDVDYIEGLSPAISIEQKTTHRNPRSTVGTVTEIYDYYRLLYARIGIPHCPKCGRVIREQSVDQILDTILSWPAGTKLQILAPVIRAQKGEHKKMIEDAAKQGFVRARIDGEMREIAAESAAEYKLEKQKKHSIEIVVDRLKLADDSRKRLAESVETALGIAEGTVIALREAARGRRGGPRKSSSRRRAPAPSAASPCPRWSPASSPSTRPRAPAPSARASGRSSSSIPTS